MSRKNTSVGNGIGVGSASILMIFILLCLTCFATLSLLSAQADYRLTSRAAQGVEDYYAADYRAEETLAALETAWLEGEESLAAVCAQRGVQRVEDRLIYDLPVDGRKTFHVELQLPEEGGPIQRVSWLELPPDELDQPTSPGLFTPPLTNAPELEDPSHAAQ